MSLGKALHCVKLWGLFCYTAICVFIVGVTVLYIISTNIPKDTVSTSYSSWCNDNITRVISIR